MALPTPLMLALSVAVLAIDPSVPEPVSPGQTSLESNATHWLAVASYAEAFPRALAKKVGAQVVATEEPFDVAVEGIGLRIKAEAKEIRACLGESA